MTNAQLTILAAFLGSLLSFFLEKIVGPFMPEKDRLKSYIKRFFYLFFRYGLTILSTIGAIIFMDLTKAFVLLIVVNFSIIIIHIVLNISTELALWKRTNEIIDLVGRMSNTEIKQQEQIDPLEKTNDKN